MTQRAARDVIVGGAQIAGVLLAAPVIRGRYNRWGATTAELGAMMPGDELVPHPRLGYTRAITINAPVEAVWPWLAQIGQGRGGLYSFDGLENLVRCNIHSLDRIADEYQHLSVGDLVRMGPDGFPCFRVQHLREPNELVLIGADPQPPHAPAHAESPTGVATWQWLLRPSRGGNRTRLRVRQRLTYPDRLRLIWHLVEPVGFVMEREMLRGLRRRAEAAPPASGPSPLERGE
jgi:hypothetical protein